MYTTNFYDYKMIGEKQLFFAETFFKFNDLFQIETNKVN